MTTFRGKIAFYIIGLLCVSLLGVLFKECERSNDLERDIDSQKNFYETEKNQLISRDSIQAKQLIDMKQNIMLETSAREVLEKEFERFKTISSHVRFESITRVETLMVAYNEPNINILADYTDYIPVDSVKKYFIQIPRELIYDDNWFEFYGTVDKDHFMIDTLSFINKFDVTIGKKKSDKSFAFLRRKEYTVELVSYNPYTLVNYVNNIVVEKKDKSPLSLPLAFSAGAISMFIGFKLIQ